LFKLALYRPSETSDDPVEQLLEDSMSAQFISLTDLKKVTAVFRPFASALLKPVYASYL